MRTKILLIITLTTALAIGSLAALSAHAANPARKALGQGGLLQRAKEKLGITDEQATEIKAVLKSDRENLVSLMTRMKDARSGLRDAIHASDATEASVRAASAKVAAVEADLAVERMKLSAKIGPILTEEQRAKLAELQDRLDDALDRVIKRADERLAE